MEQIVSYAWTDAGDCRTENQDAVYAVQGEINGHTVGLFVVADGCGGMQYGKQISHMAAAMLQYFWEMILPDLLDGTVVSEMQVTESLELVIQQINTQAYQFAQQSDSRVGSTLSVLLLIDRQYYIKNIGDSRIYAVRGRLRRLTEDQTLLADMVRNGELSPEQAEQDSRQHVLSMCIGAQESVQIHSVSGVLRRKERFLVCSDGLYGKLTEQELQQSIGRHHGSLEKCVQELRHQIAAGQATDNVSIILVQYRRKIQFSLAWFLLLGGILCFGAWLLWIFL